MDYRRDEVLDAIHRIIKIHNRRLTEEEIKRADCEILPFLEEKIIPEIEPTRVHSPKGTAVFSSKLINPAVLRYYAITQDNLSLLNDLLSRDFSFDKFGKNIPFFIFDKVLTSELPEDKLIAFLERNPFSVKRFMDSLVGHSDEEKTQAIDFFADIVEKDITLLDVGKHHSFDDGDMYNLLTIHNFNLFGKAFFLESDYNQRNIVN